MSPTIVGAGAVGLALGARLAGAGHRVRFVTRRREVADALRREGLVAEDAVSGAVARHAVEAAAWEDLPPSFLEPPILLCTRGDVVGEVAAELAERAPEADVVTFQNDVGYEEVAARHLRHVIGGVWRETCTRLGDASVRFLTGRPGRAIVGLHPEGEQPAVRALASLLESASIRTGVSRRIAEDKWLKLCVNLMSAPNALVRREDHTTEAFVEVKARLLEEARDLLRAAGITAASCDGADRSLDEEIAHQRAALGAGTSARTLALYNQVWAALETGGSLEADHYHERMLALARGLGRAAPQNQRVLDVLRAAARERRGAESEAAASLLVSDA